MDKELFIKILGGEIPPLENIIKTVELTDKNENLLKNGILNILKYKIGKTPEINDKFKLILRKIFVYFIGNISECAEFNLDLNKGLFFCGDVGVGKTRLFDVFHEITNFLQINQFKQFFATEIIDNVAVNGLPMLNLFAENYQDNRAMPITCYIDDIASFDENVNNFGTKISVIERLISMRYNVFIRYRKLTHFSSNLYPKELAKVYDDRIIDRLKEMCNIIDLSGKSFRK